MVDNNLSINAVGGPDVIRDHIIANQLLDPNFQTINRILNHFGLRHEYFETIRSYIDEIRNDNSELLENMPRRRRGRPSRGLNEAFIEPLEDIPQLPRRPGRPPRRQNENRASLGMQLRSRGSGRPSEPLIEIIEPLVNIPEPPRGRGRPRKLPIVNRAPMGNMRPRSPEPIIEIIEPLENVPQPRRGPGRPRRPLIKNIEVLEEVPRRTRGQARGQQNADLNLNDSEPTLLSIEADEAPIHVAPPVDIDWIVTKSKNRALKELASDEKMHWEFTDKWKDRKRNVIVIVAKRDNVNVGFIAGHKDEDDDEAMYISIIVVGEDFQGQNIGRMLIDRFEREARGGGFEQVTLVVAKLNLAQHFFEKIGFIRSGEESRFGNDYIDMAKDL